MYKLSVLVLFDCLKLSYFLIRIFEFVQPCLLYTSFALSIDLWSMADRRGIVGFLERYRHTGPSAIHHK